MNRMKQRKCDACNAVFFRHGSPGKNGSYCSRECRDSVKKKTCSNCGAVFHCLDRQKQTCSQKCRLQQAAIKHTKNVQRECRWCGKEFCVKPSRLKQKPASFCSRHCSESRNKLRAWMRHKQKQQIAEHRRKASAFKRQDLLHRKFTQMAIVTNKTDRWMQRLGSMCSTNKHRQQMAQSVCRENKRRIDTRTNRVYSQCWRRGDKWLTVFSIMLKTFEHRQRSDKMICKLQSIVHNQAVRQRRQIVQKQSMQEH